VASVMFLGEFEHNLDDKGRLVLPGKLREHLGQVVVSLAPRAESLRVSPSDTFEEYLNGMYQRVESGTLDLRTYQQLTAGAQDMALDSQGRIAIPMKLRESVGLSTAVVIVGSGRWIELFSPASWARATSSSADLTTLPF
jgi:MraZ protein